MISYFSYGSGSATPNKLVVQPDSFLAALQAVGFKPANVQRTLKPGVDGSRLVATPAEGYVVAAPAAEPDTVESESVVENSFKF